jgi:hypothetical protein
MTSPGGEIILFRIIPAATQYNATLISRDKDYIVIQSQTDVPLDIRKGQHIAISCDDSECYTEVLGIESGILRLKKMWTETREYFRVDDVFPVIARKVPGTDTYRKSTIFCGYGIEIPDMEVPDDTIHPQLWKVLIDVNTKLGLILEMMRVEREGMKEAESKQVNISASGIRFIIQEKIAVDDVLEIRMLLPANPPVGILTHGKVVKMQETGNGEYDVGLSFVDIDEEVRDAIIQYTLKRQREIIRKQRQQRGTNV